jgi:hypothetical protein
MFRDLFHRVERRLTFRHLLILIAYWAVLFQVIIPAIKLAGHTKTGSIVLGALALSPLLLALLVALLERPGALKNWALSLLIFLFFPALALYHDCAVLIAYLESGRRPTLWATLLVNAVILINTLPAIAKMIPRACPSCGRRTLVPLMRIFKKDRRNSKTRWCASCGATHWKDREGHWRLERRTTWLDEETEPSTTTPAQASPANRPEVPGTTHRPRGERANEIHSS